MCIRDSEDTDIFKLVQRLSEESEHTCTFDLLYKKLVNAVKLVKLDKLL